MGVFPHVFAYQSFDAFSMHQVIVAFASVGKCVVYVLDWFIFMYVHKAIDSMDCNKTELDKEGCELHQLYCILVDSMTMNAMDFLSVMLLWM